MRRPSLCNLTPWIVAGSLLLASCGGTPDTGEVGEAVGPTASPVAEVSEPAVVVETPSAVSTPAPEPTVDETPAAAPERDASEVCDGRETEAFIEVLTPTDGTVVSSPFTVTGCGNTFEASYSWRVVLADGTVVDEGFGTMTCGSGCVGTFTEELTVTGSGPATLVVYENSAEDGSEVNVTEVQIVLS